MIKLKEVNKYFNEKKVLNNVTFHVKKGDIIGVIGRNGAGKSTIFKIITGILKQNSGSCLVKNELFDINENNYISYLPETRGLDGRCLVKEHLKDMVCYKGIKRKESEKLVKFWLDRFGFQDNYFDKINTLSKGNQQKLQFIVAIANQPEILILDEPFSGLDIISRDIFWDTIKYLNNKGSTVLFSSHNLTEDMSQCDKFLFIDEGKIIEYDTLTNIQDNYPFILEIKCAEINKKRIDRLANYEILKTEKDVHYIKISCLDDARNIFNELSHNFLEIFKVRKMSLNELFIEISGDKDEH